MIIRTRHRQPHELIMRFPLITEPNLQWGTPSTEGVCNPRQRSTRFTKDKDTTANPKPTSKRARYTPEDDAKIRQLKEKGESWLAIAEQFPGRSPGAIGVRYHTYLKTNPSRGAPQLYDPQTPSVVDDEEEWEVEEIYDDRKLDDGSVKFLVK